jgi:hypothetical protein
MNLHPFSYIKTHSSSQLCAHARRFASSIFDPNSPIRTSRLIYDKFGLNNHSAIVGPFSPDEPQHYQQRSYSDDAAGVGANARILDGFGKGV